MKVQRTTANLGLWRSLPSGGSVGTVVHAYAIIIVLFVICGISAFLTPTFLNSENLTNIMRQVSIITIIAFGETMLIIAGMVDLAPGSVAALAGCIAIGTFLATHSILLAVVSAVAVGLVTGLTSGFIVTKYRVPSFIMTLAMMTIARGSYVYLHQGISDLRYRSHQLSGKGKSLRGSDSGRRDDRPGRFSQPFC